MMRDSESSWMDAIEGGSSEDLHSDLLRARRSAEEANRTKSRFLAIMSHEIRTPLNGVLGALQLLTDTNPDQGQLELIDLACSSADALRRVTDDIIDLSKLDAGHLQLEPEPFSVAALCQEASAFWSAVALGKGISLRVTVDETLPERLIGDAARIRQIINNYLSNAIKFTDTGSIDIELAVDTSMLRANEESVAICIEVRDTGIGIAPQDQKKLFTDYGQVKNGASCRRTGAGLGLAICRELAHCMGGSVGVASSPSSGSIFWVRLPLLKDTAPSPNPAPTEETLQRAPLTTEAGVPPNVLLVEDSETNQMIAQAFLEGFGCHVQVATDGLKAIEAVENSDFDIILMDVAMPHMDGVEATRRIRAMHGKVSRLPIVGQTAFVTEIEIMDFLAAGMNDVINKPLHRESLHKMLHEMLSVESGDAAHTQVPKSLSGYVDASVLDKLRENLSQDQFDKLLNRVIVDIDATGSEAISGARKGDIKTLARAGHTLKGLGASFGSPELESIGSGIHNACRNDEQAMATATALSGLSTVCQKSIVALKAYSQMAPAIPASATTGDHCEPRLTAS